MIRMQQNMRWYGPNDLVKLEDIKQAGCSGVVTALHHIPYGEVWSIKEIEERKKIIEQCGLVWHVVESLPVHEDIKRQSGAWQEYIENYKQSLINLAHCGLQVITYNFMPILDWLRTDISFQLESGARSLRFDKIDFIIFDLFLLNRPRAENDISSIELQKAEEKFQKMNKEEKESLFNNLLLGLPGSDVSFTREEVLNALGTYEDVTRENLKENLAHFLKKVVPIAEECGLKMAIHPDDPPYPLLGLDRIVSTERDLDFILNTYPSEANGLCFCTGSLGAREDNDILQMMEKYQDYIHFLHLRNTKRDQDGNFHEAPHLEGDTDMVRVVEEVLKIMNTKNRSIPMRPDHGHEISSDIGKNYYSGYSFIGRLKSLAELRGIEEALVRF